MAAVTRGTLRIYLGAAPGVGKTYAMLNEGRRRAARGEDVVVGFVESHGRRRTADQIGGLEVVQRQTLVYRDATFEEMDLDAVIARRPELALVDELAHTNVPGTRNQKRWQDVEELLDAGISVISTLNIQHLESLNDVVEQITGVVQRETIPDEVVRRADQLQLVDLAVETIRARLARGDIYPAERIDAALGNYFRAGNLAALRELALLWIADRVEEGLAEYRARHGISEPWETRERVLVALSGSPDGDRLVRRAARMAQRLNAGLIAVHVRPQTGLAAPAAGVLEHQGRLVERLGGSYREVAGADVGEALVETARALNATQIVLGATERPGWSEFVYGSVVNTVIRRSGVGLDVHVISREGDAPAAPTGRMLRRPRALPRRRVVLGFAIGAIATPLLTWLLTSMRGQVSPSGALLLFLLLVVGVVGDRRHLAGVVRGGRGIPPRELVPDTTAPYVDDRPGGQRARPLRLPGRGGRHEHLRRPGGTASGPGHARSRQGRDADAPRGQLECGGHPRGPAPRVRLRRRGAAQAGGRRLGGGGRERATRRRRSRRRDSPWRSTLSTSSWRRRRRRRRARMPACWTRSPRSSRPPSSTASWRPRPRPPRVLPPSTSCARASSRASRTTCARRWRRSRRRRRACCRRMSTGPTRPHASSCARSTRRRTG